MIAGHTAEVIGALDRKPAVLGHSTGASYKRQKRNKGVTEIRKIPNRGHSLTIDSGWREVCDAAPEFVKRFA